MRRNPRRIAASPSSAPVRTLSQASRKATHAGKPPRPKTPTQTPAGQHLFDRSAAAERHCPRPLLDALPLQDRARTSLAEGGNAHRARRARRR